MINRLVISNFLQFESLEMPLNNKLNILVGNNDTGKSTVLNAIEMVLSGRYSGRSIDTELSPHWFNNAVIEKYASDIKLNPKVEPPSIIVEAYFQPDDSVNMYKGKNNSTSRDEPGIRLEICLNPSFQTHYDTYVADSENFSTVPVEFYHIVRKDFAGEPISNNFFVKGILIDASTLRLKSGTDYYLKKSIEEHLTPENKAKLSLAFRSHRELMITDPAFAEANKALNSGDKMLSKRSVSLATDVSARSSWDMSIVPHLDGSPFELIGQGEQSAFKLLLALQKGAFDRHVVMVEEPENHLSHSNLSILLRRIEEKVDGQQLIVSTHSSFVLNKLGLDRLKLMTGKYPYFAEFENLSKETKEHFLRLAGYDTLRLLLSRSIILVEGPSDELLVQKAYLQTYMHMPSEDGVDVMSVQLTFKRFLELGKLIDRKIAVITDLDDELSDSKAKKRFQDFETPNVKGFIGKVENGRTLENQLVASAGRETLNTILETSFTTDEELIDYMTNAKTEVGLKIFDTTEAIQLPEHFYEAVKFAK